MPKELRAVRVLELAASRQGLYREHRAVRPAVFSGDLLARCKPNRALVAWADRDGLHGPTVRSRPVAAAQAALSGARFGRHSGR